MFAGHIIVRGGGDLATGVIQKFHRAGYGIIVLETEKPTAIRRSVALCEAVYDGITRVEDMLCRRVIDQKGIETCWEQGEIPLLVDPQGEWIEALNPDAVIDVILAKRNLGTRQDMAPITIALGPGFIAGKDVDIVIETMRGHNLGRLILDGSAKPNTGIPGEIGGKSAQRVIHAPVAGMVIHHSQIGDVVQEGQCIFTVKDVPVTAPFTGLLRGLIREKMTVSAGLKVADIDPRTDVDWRTISDKARCLGGAALEAYLYLSQRRIKSQNRSYI